MTDAVRCALCHGGQPARMFGGYAVCVTCLSLLEKLAERIALYSALTQPQALGMAVVALARYFAEPQVDEPAP